MTVRRHARVLTAALALVVLPVVAGTAAGGAAPARAAATEGPDCTQVSTDTEQRTVEGDNEALLALNVPRAHEIARRSGRQPGQDVTVVVVDSGIGGLAEGRVPTGHAVTELQSGHGLAVAGIVAGPDQPEPEVPVGIARAARLVDAPFYDAPAGEGDDSARPPTADGLVAALRPITAQLRGGALPARTIVVIPQVVAPSDGLRAALEAVTRAGALVIAPAGDRPTEDDPVLGSTYGEGPKPGEDAVADVWPAAEPGVVSVGVSLPEGRGTVLRNSGVDLSAPGTGSVSVGLNGGWCVLAGLPSSHWAAAQVAGVAAVVWSVHRDDTARQVRARLEGTASGNGGASSPITGHGVVQPVEALQRRPTGAGSGMGEVVERAAPPPERADVLAETRNDAVWWGLAGGGALAVLLVLRPVLARRRR